VLHSRSPSIKVRVDSCGVKNQHGKAICKYEAGLSLAIRIPQITMQTIPTQYYIIFVLPLSDRFSDRETCAIGDKTITVLICRSALVYVYFRIRSAA
jgi:hypothetical protein